MIDQGVLYLLRKESSFFDSAIHGVKHWQTVERSLTIPITINCILTA